MKKQQQPQHPAPGDVCLGCIHAPDPVGCHYFYLTPAVEFVRPDKTRGTAKWILVCERCHQLEGGDTVAAIRKGLVPIGCDREWPEGLNITIKPPVVN